MPLMDEDFISFEEPKCFAQCLAFFEPNNESNQVSLVKPNCAALKQPQPFAGSITQPESYNGKANVKCWYLLC